MAAKIMKTFLTEDSGSSTVEAVLWIPIFAGFFALVADATFLFFGQNRAYRIIQDANRSLSVGRLNSGDEVEAFVLDQLGSQAVGALVTSTTDMGKVTTTLSVPAANFVVLGLFTSLADLDVRVGASHLIEY